MMAAMALLLTLAAFLGVAEAGLFDSPLFSSGMILQRGASAASTLSRGVAAAPRWLHRSLELPRASCAVALPSHLLITPPDLPSAAFPDQERARACGAPTPRVP